MAEMLYHGANGDAILGIIARAAMEPHDGKVFFARHRWESLFMHGADRKRNASFVVKVQVSIPAQAIRRRIETPGVLDTFVVETKSVLPAQVLERYVRRPTEDGFRLQHFVGLAAIRAQLA